MSGGVKSDCLGVEIQRLVCLSLDKTPSEDPAELVWAEESGRAAVDRQSSAGALVTRATGRKRQSAGRLIRGCRQPASARAQVDAQTMQTSRPRGVHSIALVLALAIAWMPHADHAAWVSSQIMLATVLLYRCVARGHASLWLLVHLT